MNTPAIERVVGRIAGMVTETFGGGSWRPFANAWIVDDEINVYVRVCLRYIGEERLAALDVASVEVGLPGRGTFSELLTRLVRVPGYDVLYVESILNVALERYLLRSGFTLHPETYPPSVYLRVGALPADWRPVRMSDTIRKALTQP